MKKWTSNDIKDLLTTISFAIPAWVSLHILVGASATHNEVEIKGTDIAALFVVIAGALFYWWDDQHYHLTKKSYCNTTRSLIMIVVCLAVGIGLTYQLADALVTLIVCMLLALLYVYGFRVAYIYLRRRMLNRVHDENTR